MTAAVALDAPPPPTPSEFAVKDGAEVEAPLSSSAASCRWRLPAFVKLDWFGSRFFLVLLQLASVGFALAWYVHVPFSVAADTLSTKFALKLSNVKLYSDWGIAMIIVMPFVMQCALAGMCVSSKGASRVWLGVLCAVYVFLVALGHGLGAIETHSRRANEAVFADEFNRVYCSSRTMRVCIDGDGQKMLTLVGRGSAPDAALRASETVTDAAFATWGQCSQIFLGINTEFASSPDQPSGSYSIQTGVADKLLGECVGSPDTDAWCGTASLAGTTLTAEANLAHPAPYAANTRLFAAFTGEWGARMDQTDKLLGAAVGCLLLAMWCSGLREDSF